MILLFGQIAAANALSDVYAMGGIWVALNIVGAGYSPDVLWKFMKESTDRARPSLIGGHSIQNDEPDAYRIDVWKSRRFKHGARPRGVNSRQIGTNYYAPRWNLPVKERRSLPCHGFPKPKG